MLGTFTATLHLTHDCNLRCSYCYGGEKGGGRMSSETADAAVAFAAREARRQGAQHLEVVFFGGEPLLFTDAGEHRGSGGTGQGSRRKRQRADCGRLREHPLAELFC